MTTVGGHVVSKSEVYSWRVSPETKAALEDEARRRGVSLAELMETITQAWLESSSSRDPDDEAEQARLHAAARRVLGTIHGGDPHRSERVRATVQQRVRARREMKRG
jgi:hypothetical protein